MRYAAPFRGDDGCWCEECPHCGHDRELDDDEVHDDDAPGVVTCESCDEEYQRRLPRAGADAWV